MLKYLDGLGELNLGRENHLEVGQKLEELKDRMETSDKNIDGRLTEDKKELGARRKALKAEIPTSRKRLQGSIQEEYIIDIRQLPSMAESRKDIFAPLFQEIRNSGIEIDPENATQREEDRVSGNGAGSHCESETVAGEGKWPMKEESIIKPMRRAEASSLGGGV